MTAHAQVATASTSDNSPLRHDWQQDEILALFDMPFMDLVFKAAEVHRLYHDPNKVQLSQLISIKTGGCAEDCGYCSQSAKYKNGTGLDATKLMEVERVLEGARRAKAGGASRYCMGAAWTSPKDRDMDTIIAMVKGVKELGMESCMTLGMLDDCQTQKLADAGLDYYNHNIDTSEEYYGEIITTRTYQDRLDTLERVRNNGINVCSGGIVGMGEKRQDRAGMLKTLANLPKHPESVPINMLVAIPGTPLEHVDKLDPFEFVRTIAVARIMMPMSEVRLSAGRQEMSEETQALCFMAGASSIFYGEQLLTTPNPENNKDLKLFDKLGLKPA
ncbi:biotin synthase [Kordiimonas sediminis]|uniref:Biotin synthase n=1 Tax=Kordiimonas sediminis TaxID=1735581 RepID=A0A919ASI1_9PROT|nr:biotin synthase BioB [Kordiimonas sediminis]GHF22866.1 biotin synthase [Kordiimonas sediminis]